MNPYAILGAAGLWLASCGFAYYKGGEHAINAEEAAKAREEKLVQVTKDAALSATAEVLSKVELRNVTINKALEREVITREVFRDCRSGSTAVQLLNSTPGVAPAAPASSASGS
jgi:outer membrane receptor protein involved in Fe transport